MSLDSVSIEMIQPHLRYASVLCLGYPEMPNGVETVGWLLAHGAVTVACVDLIAHKGFERIIDLNEHQIWPQEYSLVINPGTLEHCFNIGEAWANAWRAVALGGRLLMVAPASMHNHGFWNVNPVAFSDWCTENGGKVERFAMAKNGTAEPAQVIRIVGSASNRGALPPETVLYALMRKEVSRAMRWPTQGIYRR